MKPSPKELEAAIAFHEELKEEKDLEQLDLAIAFLMER